MNLGASFNWQAKENEKREADKSGWESGVINSKLDEEIANGGKDGFCFSFGCAATMAVKTPASPIAVCFFGPGSQPSCCENEYAFCVWLKSIAPTSLVSESLGGLSEGTPVSRICLMARFWCTWSSSVFNWFLRGMTVNLLPWNNRFYCWKDGQVWDWSYSIWLFCESENSGKLECGERTVMDTCQVRLLWSNSAAIRLSNVPL